MKKSLSLLLIFCLAAATARAGQETFPDKQTSRVGEETVWIQTEE